MPLHLKAVNTDDEPPNDASQPFVMRTNPGTDMWEKPPATHSFNAPIFYHESTLSNFKSARITVDAHWTEQYDQGGLAFVLTAKDGTRRWIKAGIEYYQGKPYVALVGTDRWSDWSLRPVTDKGTTSATIEMVRNPDGALWVFAVSLDGVHEPMREVAWVGDLSGETTLWVGSYCCRPEKKTSSVLDVRFRDFNVEIE